MIPQELALKSNACVKKSAVAIIYTPLQFLNLLEYVYASGYSSKEFLVFLIASKGKVESLEEFAVSLNAPGFKFLAIASPVLTGRQPIKSFLSCLFFRRRIKGLLEKSGCEDFRVLVHSTVDKGIVRYLSKKIKKNKGKRVLIDDGMGSFLLYKNNSSRLIKKKPWWKAGEVIQKIVFGSCDLYCLKNCEVFTMFDLGSLPQCDIKKNSYNFSKENIISPKAAVVDGLVHFIGQPLVELGLISMREYVEIIESVYAESLDFVYFPHPSEAKEKLNAMAEKISGISFSESKQGYEFNISSSSFLPCKVFTYFSSASYVANILLKEKGVSFFFIHDGSVEGKQRGVFEVYEILEQGGLSRISNTELRITRENA